MSKLGKISEVWGCTPFGNWQALYSYRVAPLNLQGFY